MSHNETCSTMITSKDVVSNLMNLVVPRTTLEYLDCERAIDSLDAYVDSRIAEYLKRQASQKIDNPVEAKPSITPDERHIGCQCEFSDSQQDYVRGVLHCLRKRHDYPYLCVLESKDGQDDMFRYARLIAGEHLLGSERSGVWVDTPGGRRRLIGFKPNDDFSVVIDFGEPTCYKASDCTISHDQSD